MCILILVLCKIHPNNKNICVQVLPSVPWLWKRHFFYSFYSIYIKGKDDRSKISIALNSCDFQKSNFHCWNEHKTKWDIMPITVALAPEWLCVHRKIHLMEKFFLKIYYNEYGGPYLSPQDWRGYVWKGFVIIVYFWVYNLVIFIHSPTSLQTLQYTHPVYSPSNSWSLYSLYYHI